MEPRKALLTLVLPAALALGSCGILRSPALRLTEADAGSSVQIRKGQELQLALKGNPTTGYGWEVVPGSEAVLAQQGEPRYEADSSLLGAGGVFTFTFKAVAQGETTLRLIYHRSFEPGVAPLQTFQVKVTVGP